MKTKPNISFIISSSYLNLFFRVALGFIFVYASLDKIKNPFDFAQVIYNYQILPEKLVNLFAITLPWIEFVSGVLLIIGFLTEGASFVILCMLLTFVLAISINLIRGVDISCGCFSTSGTDSKIGLGLLIRDILMTIMSLQIIFSTKSHISVEYLINRIWKKLSYVIPAKAGIQTIKSGFPNYKE